MADDVKGLEVLAEEKNNKAILLFEAAALFHDMGKCADYFLQPDGIGFKATNCQDSPHVNPHKAIFSPIALQNLSYWNLLSPNRGQCARSEESAHNTALWNTLNLLNINTSKFDKLIKIPSLGFEATIKELILWGRPIVCDKYLHFQTILGHRAKLSAYIGRSHQAAHVEKEESNFSSSIFVSSPFGFEENKLEMLDQKLKRVLEDFQSYPDNYTSFQKTVKENFQLATGDTRIPVNEVTLFDWSHLVASLYKAAIAGILFGYNPEPKDLRWRLLSIRFDGFDFFGKTNRISDLLVRRNLLVQALDNVRRLLEIEYPLGTEVYRDENGSIFVVPGCEKGNCTLDLLALKTRGKPLKELIHDEVEKFIEKEIIPKINVDKVPWWGQAPDRNSGNNELPPITDHLKPISTFPDPEWIQQQCPEEISEDICTVCGFRPQGPGQKAKDRNVCEICEKRREDRSQEWAQARHPESQDQNPWQKTIWIDEVADKNGRLALIVGKFDLKEWLNGDMIQTLLVVCDEDNPNNCTQKNPSFARIQRVWRTTQEFWKQVEEEDVKDVVRCDHKRVGIKVSFPDGNRLKGKFHAYDAEIDGKRISLVWDDGHDTLITAVNLSTWANGGVNEFCGGLKENPEIKLFEAGGYGQQREQLTTATFVKEEIEFPSYTPIVPLLSQPSSFMILVPASDALNVAQKITQRYELEMSKVRNRLPLQLGTIFFDKRQPFFSALDAGRRMLKSKFNSEECCVTCSCACSKEHGDEPSRHLNHNHFKKWHELRLNNSNGKQLHWRASTVMGDGSTDDDWYPYIHVLKDQHNQIPAGRKQFEHPNNPGQHWVHVSEVQVGDTVQYTTSRFTWLHLDTSARRFEALDDNRMYPLEELERIIGLWERLETLAKKKRLTQSQLQAVVSLLAAKRKDWKDSPEQFKQLAETTLRTEGLDGVSMDDVTSGRLENMFELYHHILKKKVNDKNSEGEES